jgi:di/tricarboxylate transporter
VVVDWAVANWPIVVVLALAVVALVFFAFEILPIEITALGVLVILGVTGIIPPTDLFSGFASSATITVLMMFILSAAVLQTGIVDWLGDRVGVLMGRSTARQVLFIGLIVGPVSAFINNTAAVAVLIPLVTHLAAQAKKSPSKLLMPLSFAAMLGGTVTLIGTSTNLLANALRIEAGLGSFGIFDFALPGLIVFGVGMVYLALVGHFLIPERLKAMPVDERYALREFLFEVLVPEGSKLLGQVAGAGDLAIEYDAEIIRVRQRGKTLAPGLHFAEYKAGDRLLIRSTRSNLQRMVDTGIVELLPAAEAEKVDLEDVEFSELLVHPTSPARSRKLATLAVWRQWRVHPVALLSRGRRTIDRLDQHVLAPGDIVLVSGAGRDIKALTGGDVFHVLGGPRAPVRRPHKAALVLLILAGVVGAAALNLMSIALSATAGVVLVAATGALRPVEMYRNVNWDVIFLLAGIIPLGLAMQSTGAAMMLADVLARSGDFLPPLGVLMLLYFITTLMTEVLSNNASVVLIVPVAVELAQQLGYNPIPFILIPMFAASTSFLTPVGYQTNLMVMGPGGYRYTDYFRVGAPLNVLMLIVTPFVISVFFLL